MDDDKYKPMVKDLMKIRRDKKEERNGIRLFSYSSIPLDQTCAPHFS